MTSHSRICLWIALLCVAIYEITSYGGIRSPDSEIIFRTSEALATKDSVAVDEDLVWQGFGLAQGVDGKKYAIFGLGESVAAAPLVMLGEELARSGLFSGTSFPIPASFYEGYGEQYFTLDRMPPDRAAQGIRWVAAQLNILVTTATVVLLYLTAARITRDKTSALVTAILFGFCTMAWPYSGTFFSEPLASLLTLASFYLLLPSSREPGARSAHPARLLFAGISLGMATATHITAILFAPFFLFYAAFPQDEPSALRNWRPRAAVSFLAGLALLLAMIGYYNYARFGNPLETGRTVNPEDVIRFQYGEFTNPALGLYGLLLSPNKGLLWFSPVVMVGLYAWKRMHRRYRALSYALAGAVIFRIIFIASRSDWHSGFCLGPRYLVMILPYLCLPVAFLVGDLIRSRSAKLPWFALGAWLLACQQYYFSIGEIFTYYGLKLQYSKMAGIDSRTGYQIYLDWKGSSLSRLMSGFSGSYILRLTGLDNMPLLLIGSVLMGMVITACYIFAMRGIRTRKPEVRTRN